MNFQQHIYSGKFFLPLTDNSGKDFIHSREKDRPTIRNTQWVILLLIGMVWVERQVVGIHNLHTD